MTQLPVAETLSDLEAHQERIRALEYDLSQIRALLHEALSDGAETRSLFLEEKQIHEKVKRELASEVARSAALAQDLENSSMPNHDAQLRTELERVRSALSSVSLTFKDWLTLTLPPEASMEAGGNPLAAMFVMAEEALDSSSRLLEKPAA